jgi:hypothetical protein
MVPNIGTMRTINPGLTSAEAADQTRKGLVNRTRSSARADYAAIASRHLFTLFNLILPIKRADLGIAMGEGSQAAKTVSSVVLEHNDFAMLPETIEEGRTIVRNLRRAAKLFLVKNVYSLLLILFYVTGVFDVPFPYLPQQVSLLNWMVIGIPALLIALTRERSGVANRTPFLRDVGWFAVRTGVIFAVAGVVLLALSKHLWGHDEKTQRTMLLTMLVLLGITVLQRVLTEGNHQPLAADRRLRWLSLIVIPGYLIAMYWPFSAVLSPDDVRTGAVAGSVGDRSPHLRHLVAERPALRFRTELHIRAVALLKGVGRSSPLLSPGSHPSARAA